MKNVKVSEIMNIIEDIIKLDGEESNALEIRIDQLLKSKKGTELSSNSWESGHKRFVDEWGNSDWRDTGEMGG